MEYINLVLYMHNGKLFVSKVKERLKSTGRNFDDLLEKACVNPSTAWRWEQGSRPTIETIKRMEKVLKRWEYFPQSKASKPSARA